MKGAIRYIILLIIIGFSMQMKAAERDIIKTSEGDLTITFLGHGTLMMEFNGKVIHIDPVGMFGYYPDLPKADLVLVTHEHGDHLDLTALGMVKKESTEVVLTEKCAETYNGGTVMKNGDSGVFAGIKVDAVPAYNIKHVRSEGNPYHAKGVGNGYVLHFGNNQVYVAGDTENIPEMADLKDIDVAFLPMNLPYTMTPEMVAEATKMFHPKILYPYHYGDTDTTKLIELMKSQPETEVRIRDLK